ncbi:MAG: hypothetical protein AAFP76_17315 [Bacteroidota bacterium]
MFRKILILVALVFGFSLFSCGNFNPKPDKRIQAIIQLADRNASSQEIDHAMLSIKRRFEKFGAYPTLEKVTGNSTIQFTLETDAPADRVRKFLSISGQLAFYHMPPRERLLEFLGEADHMLRDSDSSGMAPFLRLAYADVNGFSGSTFHVAAKDTAEVNRYLAMRSVINLLGPDKNRIKFLWGQRTKTEPSIPLYMLKLNKFGKAALEEDVVATAAQNYDYLDQPSISIVMTKEASSAWEEMTGRAFKDRTQIAVVLDNVVFSAPGVNGPIQGGRSEITGDFTVEEARDLASSIASGSIPKIEILEYHVMELK